MYVIYKLRNSNPMISKFIWACMLKYFIDGDTRFKSSDPWAGYKMWKGD